MTIILRFSVTRDAIQITLFFIASFLSFHFWHFWQYFFFIFYFSFFFRTRFFRCVQNYFIYWFFVFVFVIIRQFDYFYYFEKIRCFNFSNSRFCQTWFLKRFKEKFMFQNFIERIIKTSFRIFFKSETRREKIRRNKSSSDFFSYLIIWMVHK